MYFDHERAGYGLGWFDFILLRAMFCFIWGIMIWSRIQEVGWVGNKVVFWVYLSRSFIWLWLIYYKSGIHAGIKLSDPVGSWEFAFSTDPALQKETIYDDWQLDGLISHSTQLCVQLETTEKVYARVLMCVVVSCLFNLHEMILSKYVKIMSKLSTRKIFFSTGYR